MQSTLGDGPVSIDPSEPDNLADLAADEDLPDAPPKDVGDTRSDHQQKDTGIQPEEVIDLGEDAAAQINDPLRNHKATDYRPTDAEQEGFDADGSEEAFS